MTGRATFGDFILAAHRHLDPAAGGHGAAGIRGSAEEVSQSLQRVVGVMSRYVADLTAAFEDVPAHSQRQLGPWASAGVKAREALANSRTFLLSQDRAPRWPRGPGVSPVARRLDAVAASLTTGRDLLETHFATGPDGARRARSEWAPVITSPAAGKVMLAELGALSRQIARQGTDVALAGGLAARRAGSSRRTLNHACQWLWALDAAVRAAHQHQPLSIEDRELLHAIPANVLPLRRLPSGRETVSTLCEGTIATAERLRHLAWIAADRAHRSPALTITSLRRVAENSALTSRHCDLLLHALAKHVEPGGLRKELLAAAEAADSARDSWQRAAQSLDRVTTDLPGHLSPPAAESEDLALWTGRLAYADPTWTISRGSDHAPRPPGELAQRPDDVRMVIAAVHHASHTLAHLAHADREQIHGGARTGRLLVSTRTMPETFDIPRAFTRAPDARVRPLAAAYTDTDRANREAVGAVAVVAEATGAASRLLTRADAAAEPAVGVPGISPGEEASLDRERAPGPVERVLHNLGVTRPDLIRRAAEADRISEQLIIEAANEGEWGQRRPGRAAINRSVRTAELVNHAVASGDPRTTRLLHRPSSAQREAPDREP